MSRRALGPRLAAAGGVAVLLLAVALIVGIAGRGGSSHASTAVPARLSGELKGRAVWPANTGDLRARLSELRLPALSREGTRLHIHQHLDVFVDGRRVPVPAGIGIDPSGLFISPLHTHDASGVIHVESPTARAFTLGEFFGVWGIRFRAGCLGGYCAGHGRALLVFVDGRRLRRDPSRLVLAAHREIVVALGTPAQLPRPVPARYAFPVGL